MISSSIISGLLKTLITIGLSLLIGYLAKVIQKRHYKNFPDNTKKAYPKIFSEDSGYKYFTTGHPYVWVDISFDDFIKTFNDGIYVKSNTGQKLYCIYSIKVDETEKHVYLAPLQKNFNFSSLKHYQEWLDSEKKVAENIRKYKAGEIEL